MYLKWSSFVPLALGAYIRIEELTLVFVFLDILSHEVNLLRLQLSKCYLIRRSPVHVQRVATPVAEVKVR